MSRDTRAARRLRRLLDRQIGERRPSSVETAVGLWLQCVTSGDEFPRLRTVPEQVVERVEGMWCAPVQPLYDPQIDRRS